MKKLVLAFVASLLLVACGGNSEEKPVEPAGLHYNEESGGYCGDGVCYPPWMTKEECEEAERKRKASK